MVFRPLRILLFELKQSEELLKESELSYRALADSGQTLIWTAGTDKLCNYFNRVWLEFTGRTMEQEMGNGWAEGVHPDDLDRCFTIYTSAFDRHEYFTMEYRLRRYDGEYRWIFDEGSPRYDEQGNFIGYIGHCLDITERKQAEESIAMLALRNQTLLQTASDGVHVLDDQGNVVEVNNAFCRMLGYTREELLNLNVTDWDTLWSKEELSAKVVELISHPAVFETNHRRKDGTTYSVEINGVGITLDGRNYLYGSARDISERKQAEEKLHQLSQAVEQSPVSIVITDTTGNIQYVNQKFVEITGYSLEEAIGKNPRILKSGDTSLDVYKKLWQVLTAGEEWHGKFHNRKKNGDLYWESATISPIVNARGETTHYLAVKEDITERKKFEEEIVESRDRLRELALRMEQIREEERTTIAREVHDELGQNLTGLKMNLSWLTKKLNTDEKLRERVLRMRDLVDTTIQEVRRIATELRPGILDELGLAAAMVWHGKKFEEGSGIECIIDIDPQIEKISQQCSTAIFRIFQEALTNVGRHSEATLVKTTLTVRNDGLYLEISDNGLGIDSAKLNDRTSIGLLGMKERALALGGEVTITRLPDSGTKITTTIPV